MNTYLCQSNFRHLRYFVDKIFISGYKGRGYKILFRKMLMLHLPEKEPLFWLLQMLEFTSGTLPLTTLPQTSSSDDIPGM